VLRGFRVRNFASSDAQASTCPKPLKRERGKVGLEEFNIFLVKNKEVKTQGKGKLYYHCDFHITFITPGFLSFTDVLTFIL
jgi:hypothetical protein